ncbi:S1C family serine protease [Virgibacillus oceani]|uniref:Peptidase S1 n=1 Tax=Virgibacillus oceani TaxID=1479511 RepID=A0A917H801_9BACI|nr:trypsin-like peptidase domain-containing protein [Virgibacillus oceani]GGG70424.1 peptidase S1 [Virgibacillus oceani]
MHKKQYGPIIVSILIVIIGVTGMFLIHQQWRSEGVSVNNPGINKVSTNEKVLDLKTIIHDAEKNVMQIEAQNSESTLTGSGFLYNEKGDIITNAHVVKDADVIYVRTVNAKIFPAAVVGIGEDTDIAVIRVPQLAGQTPLPVASEDDKTDIGDEVIALGSPHGFQNTVTLGIISGTERNFSLNNFNYEDIYQISAQITHGNSGGPLIKRSTGEVIGINSVGTEDGTIGFSIPIANVYSQIEEWSAQAKADQLDYASTSDIVNNFDPEQFKQDAQYLIEYYFDSILARDYVGAYTLIGSDMQAENTYSNFREGYVHITNLVYDDFSGTISDDNNIITSVNVTSETKLQNQQETTKKQYTYSFTIGYENDQLKILNIDVKENKK